MQIKPEPRSRLRKGKGEQLRQEIIDATRELVAERGNLDTLSIREIAQRVGVSPPSIYLHFDNKDQLTYTVCREMFEGFGARLLPILNSEGEILERLRRLGLEYIRWGLDNAALYPVLFLGEPPESSGLDEMAGDPGLLVLEGLVALVSAGMAEGVIASDSSAEATAWAMWAAVHGTVLLLSSKMEWMQAHLATAASPIAIPGIDEVIETVIEAVFRAFSPR
jgi:AcrR family transcriptional regulator